MPAPQFRLAPGLLQQLASGGGFQPGQAMLQGLALGQERQQNQMSNMMDMRRMDLQEKQIGLSEQRLQSELDRLKQDSATKIRRMQFLKSNPEDTPENRKRALALDLDPSKVFSQTTDQELEEYRAKKQIDQQFSQDDKPNFQKGGTVYKDGERAGRAVFDPEQGYVWADSKEPISSDYDVVTTSIQATSQDDAFKGTKTQAFDLEDAKANMKSLGYMATKVSRDINENPGSVGWAGSIASTALSMAENAKNLLKTFGAADNTDKSKTMSEYDWGQIGLAGEENAKLRSTAYDMAYTYMAAVKGQTGRGLSDQDVEFALNMLSADNPRAFNAVLDNWMDNAFVQFQNRYEIHTGEDLGFSLDDIYKSSREGSENGAAQLKGNMITYPDGTQYTFPDAESAEKAYQELK